MEFVAHLVREMNTVNEISQDLLVLGSILLLTIYLSVGIAVARGQQATNLPRPLQSLGRYWDVRNPSRTGVANVGVVLLVFFQIVPLALLLWPSSHLSLVSRLLAALLFAAEAAWWAYLRRFLTRKPK